MKDIELVKILITKQEAKRLQYLMDLEEVDFEKEGLDYDSAFRTLTARFSNGFEADIKMCSGQTNCFIDPVLFDKEGHEILCLECVEDVLGEYDFEYEDKIYRVELDTD